MYPKRGREGKNHVMFLYLAMGRMSTMQWRSKDTGIWFGHWPFGEQKNWEVWILRLQRLHWEFRTVWGDEELNLGRNFKSENRGSLYYIFMFCTMNKEKLIGLAPFVIGSKLSIYFFYNYKYVCIYIYKYMLIYSQARLSRVS